MKIIRIFLLCVFPFSFAVAAEPKVSSESIQFSSVKGDHSTAMSAGTMNFYGKDLPQILGVKAIDLAGTKVAITRAYLLPLLVQDLKIDDSNETRLVKSQEPTRLAAFFCLEVANISSSPLLVTTIKLEIKSAKNSQLTGGPSSGGQCPGKNISDVSPNCLLQPGERKRWLLQDGFNIPGGLEFLNEWKDEQIFDNIKPRMITKPLIVKRFNEYLKSIVGENTYLKVDIAELDDRSILSGLFQLTNGGTIFDNKPTARKINGRQEKVFPLQHDVFLGEALYALKTHQNYSALTSCSKE